MTEFLVTGQADWWHVFWTLASWSAAYLIAGGMLREILANPRTWLEKYGLWFGRIVGIIGAAIIFAYGYHTTSQLEKVEHECERYKALAAERARGVDSDEVAEISVDTGRCVVSWINGQYAYTTSLTFGSGDTSGRVRSLQRSFRGQSESESAGIQCRSDCDAGSCGELHAVPTGSPAGGERF